MDITIKLVKDGYVKLFNIRKANTLVGHVSISEHDSAVHIVSISILHRYRKQGIATFVVDTMARKYGLLHGKSNPISIGFWQKVGAEFKSYVTPEMVYDLLDTKERPEFTITK